MAIGASGLIREKCKRHAIAGNRSLNWSPAARTDREQFLDKNGNPRYACKSVGRAVPRRGGGRKRRGDGTERKLRSAALNGLTTFPSRSIGAGPGAAGQETPTAADVQRLPTPRRKAAGARCGRDRPAGARPPHSHKSNSRCFSWDCSRWRVSPSPRSGEGGRRPDGVRKAGMVRRRFAVTFVQAVWRRSGGPHTIRRFAPPSPASWGRDPRGDLKCVNTAGGAAGRSESDPQRTGRMRVGWKCFRKGLKRLIPRLEMAPTPGRRSACPRHDVFERRCTGPNASRPEMAPQRLEKIDSAPGNGDIILDIPCHKC